MLVPPLPPVALAETVTGELPAFEPLAEDVAMPPATLFPPVPPIAQSATSTALFPEAFPTETLVALPPAAALNEKGSALPPLPPCA